MAIFLNIFHFSTSRLLRKAVIAVCLVSMLTACATRQPSDTLQGSTAQRLVTYSLEKFVDELLSQPQLSALANSKTQLRVHFMQDHPMVNYATALITRQLEVGQGIRVAANGEETANGIDVFFNSIGTDQDSFGLSVPTFGLASTPDTRINVLAVDMYHGVTEGYAVVQLAGGEVQRTQRVLARVRADNFATPVLEFPVNQLD